MTSFKDPTRLGLAAIIALCAYMVLKTIYTIILLSSSASVALVGLLAILYLVSLITCYIMVGCWIYRTNANAHIFNDFMSVSPGWAVGWFFVPFMNLVMPYRGVKETWDESHEFAGRQADKASPLLGWWWGLWLADNVASNVASRLGRDPLTLEGVGAFDMIAAVAGIGASLLLIQVIRRLDRVQLVASHGGVFA